MPAPFTTHGTISCVIYTSIHISISFQGVADHPDYRITFYMDSKAMINVLAPKYGVVDVGCESPGLCSAGMGSGLGPTGTLLLTCPSTRHIGQAARCHLGQAERGAFRRGGQPQLKRTTRRIVPSPFLIHTISPPTP